MKLNQVMIACTHLQRSVSFYSLLGLKLIVKTDLYARFECPDEFSTFSIHVENEVMPGSTCIYFECESLEEKVNMLKSKGVIFLQEPTMQSWLWMESYLMDPDGNKICLFYAGENRRFPPWRITDVQT